MPDVQIARQGRILDFDIENRPLAYWYDDKTTGEITAIAWAWYGPHGENKGPIGLGEPTVHVRTLAPPPQHEYSMERMLAEFVTAYDEADIVTGHYIRMHDLPIINSHLIEFGLPTLAPKRTIDTKLDLIKHSNLSASQMALSKMLDVQSEKPRMTNMRWRDANRLTPEGIEAAVNRVVGDVKQHMELRLAMTEARLLKAPRMWMP